MLVAILPFHTFPFSFAYLSKFMDTKKWHQIWIPPNFCISSQIWIPMLLDTKKWNQQLTNMKTFPDLPGARASLGAAGDTWPPALQLPSALRATAAGRPCDGVPPSKANAWAGATGAGGRRPVVESFSAPYAPCFGLSGLPGLDFWIFLGRWEKCKTPSPFWSACLLCQCVRHGGSKKHPSPPCSVSLPDHSNFAERYRRGELSSHLQY